MMKPLRTLSILIACAATIALAADGFVIKPAPKKKGDVAKRLFKAKLTAGPYEVDITSTRIEKILEVKDAGEYVTEFSSENDTILIGGADTGQSIPGSIVEFLPNGEIKKFRGEVDGDEYRYYRLLNWHYAEGEKKVGDKWTIDLPGDSKIGTVNLKGEYELLAEEKVDGVDTLKIKFLVKETEGTEPASHEGTTWISKSDFQQVKAEGKWTAMPVPKAPVTASGTYTLTAKK